MGDHMNLDTKLMQTSTHEALKEYPSIDSVQAEVEKEIRATLSNHVEAELTKVWKKKRAKYEKKLAELDKEQ